MEIGKLTVMFFMQATRFLQVGFTVHACRVCLVFTVETPDAGVDFVVERRVLLYRSRHRHLELELPVQYSYVYRSCLDLLEVVVD